MKPFTLHVAEGIREGEKNTIYAKEVLISSLDDLASAVIYDHVPCSLRDNYRNDKNFMQADVVMMDIDNTHSDNPSEWITHEDIAARLEDVDFYYYNSRNHMKEKKGRSPRPKEHLAFPLSEPVTSAERIRNLQQLLITIIPEFDKGAAKATQFFYGVANPQCGHQEGSMCIDEVIYTIAFMNKQNNPSSPQAPLQAQPEEEASEIAQEDSPSAPQAVKEGHRHSTMVTCAVSALLNYSTIEKAHQVFLKHCERCTPPLPVAECNQIWDWAIKAHKAAKKKFTPEFTLLTPAELERIIKSLDISLCFNVITKDHEVSDLPQSKYIQPSYYTLTGLNKKEASIEILPLMLECLLKENSYRFSRDFLKSTLNSLARTNRYNPVRDMLNNTKWDGEDRLEALCNVLHIQNDLYYCTFLQKWLHQAVAFALNDDGDLDGAFVLVLQGAQGAGKTNFFRKLAMRNEWFCESAVINMDDKDTIIRATSAWICELGELDSTLKKEQSSLKGFITQKVDEYRPPYGAKNLHVVRNTVFCATVNPQEFIRDTTGSRRFVCIHIDDIDKDFIFKTMTPEWVAQLWRQIYEASYLPLGRSYYHLTKEQQIYSEGHNEQSRVELPAERELLDLIDWDKSQAEVDYKWYTATDVFNCSKALRKYTAKAIGEALTRICEKHPIAQKKVQHHQSRYWLPELPEDD